MNCPDPGESETSRGFLVIGEPGISAGAMVTDPSGLMAVPDTSIDSYRVGTLDIRAASVMGLSHRHANTPRQDHYLVTSDSAGFIAVAVCDGVGSARMSHRAARAAADAATRTALEEAVRNGIDNVNWPAVVAAASAAVIADARSWGFYGEPIDEVQNLPENLAQAVSRFSATTLTVAVVPTGPGPDDRWPIALAQVGDSPAWLLSDGAWDRITEFDDVADDEFASTNVHALPKAVDKFRITRREASRGDALFMMTDGIGNSLGGGTGEVGRTLSQRWAIAPDGLRFAAQVGFARKTFVDDQTCVGVWFPPPATP